MIFRMISVVIAGIILALILRLSRAKVSTRAAAKRLGPKDEEPLQTSELPGWGGVQDPQQDCRIKTSGPTLTIEIPGSLHDLSVEQAEMTAPRLLREIEGDFAVEVTVAGEVDPTGGQTSSYALPYHGAGLLIWLDRDNYIRLERAAILHGSEKLCYVNFEMRSHAMLAHSTGGTVADEGLALRIERRGSRILAAYRVAGQDWMKLGKDLNIRRWRQVVRVGIVAVNTATSPLVATFRDLKIKSIET